MIARDRRRASGEKLIYGGVCLDLYTGRKPLDLARPGLIMDIRYSGLLDFGYMEEI